MRGGLREMSDRHFTLTDVQAEAVGSLHLIFADGAVMQVDLMARVGEWGGSVVWGDDPDGDLELAADNLRAWAIEQAAHRPVMPANAGTHADG
jgi:hypothetical protein